MSANAPSLGIMNQRLVEVGRSVVHAIYVAQNKFFSTRVCDLLGVSTGLYLVKIGKTQNLADRAQTINGRVEDRDWRYLGVHGWRMIRYREVLPHRLDRSEEDSLSRFTNYGLSFEERLRLAGRANTALEMFLGDSNFLDQLCSEFRSLAHECGSLVNLRDVSEADFHQTTHPDWEPAAKGPLFPGQETLNRIRSKSSKL